MKSSRDNEYMTGREYQAMTIDNLVLRKHINKHKLYYDNVHTKGKRIRLMDAYDYAHALAGMNQRKLGTKYVQVGYIILGTNKYVKLREYKTQLKRQRLHYIENNNYLIVEGGKTYEIYVTNEKEIEKIARNIGE